MEKILYILAFMALFSCKMHAQTQYRFADNGPHQADIRFNIVNDSTLSFADPDDETEMKNYIKEYFPKQISVISGIKLDKTAEDKYLIFVCSNEETENLNVAFCIRMGESELVPDIDLDGGYGHSCTGSNCSCCAFIKSKKGTIVGCYCNNAPALCEWKSGQKCDHTVTTR